MTARCQKDDAIEMPAPYLTEKSALPSDLTDAPGRTARILWAEPLHDSENLLAGSADPVHDAGASVCWLQQLRITGNADLLTALRSHPEALGRTAIKPGIDR